MDAAQWDRKYAASDSLWGRDPGRWVVAELTGLPPGSALDVACGEGRDAVWLAEQGWDVTGVDFSSVAIDRAREQARAAAERAGRELPVAFEVADVRDLAEAAGRDLVLASYVHLPAYERTPFLRACAAALAPGGTMLVVGHDATNLEEGHGGPQDASVLFTAEDVVADVQDHIGSGQLAVERSGRVAREVDVEGGTAIAWDCLVRLRRRGQGDGPF